jgi:glutamine synthetase
MALNTIVAESVDAICDKLEAMKGDFNENLQKLLQRLVKAHRRVVFSGDGYSSDWPKEAAKRGLPNLRDTPAALEPLRNAANIALFERYGVLSETEMRSRWEIGHEDYLRRVRIEASVALEIARSMVRPVVADEFSRLATALGQAKADGLKYGVRGLTALSSKLGAGLDDLHVKCDRLEKALSRRRHDAQLKAMEDLRRTVDRLEGLVDDSRWPLPKYREMLFVY